MNTPWNEWDTESQTKYKTLFPPPVDPTSSVIMLGGPTDPTTDPTTEPTSSVIMLGGTLDPTAEPTSMITIENIMTLVGFHRVCCRTRVLTLVHVWELAQKQIAARDPELKSMRIFRKEQSNPQPPRVFVLSNSTMQKS